jgi:hypothetical protein
VFDGLWGQVHRGEVECAAVVAGVLVLSGGQPALFDLAEVALDDDAVGVAAGVQADRVAAGTAPPASVGLLVAGVGAVPRRCCSAWLARLP